MTDVRLRRYQVMEPLGRGGQGRTFRGIDRADQSEVAIKVISLRGLADWKRFDLFERECKVLQRLQHPGIPRFVDHYASESTGDFFLVMSLAPGRSLADRRKAGERFGPTELRRVLEQLLDILAYLHAQSPAVIHRDIKPANIVMADTGALTLVDFGGVRSAFHDGGSTMIGSFGYMAPEQLHGEASPATDIFAVGATMVALATGREPEDLPRKGLGIDLERVMAKHPLRPVLAQMLAPDPDERLGSVAEVRAALAAAQTREAPRAKARDAKIERRRPTDAAKRAHISPELERLAATENRALRVLLWLFASLGAGALVLMQAVVLPLAYAVARKFARDDEARAEAKRDHLDNIEALRQSHAGLRYLADATHPLDEGP